jgi:hypothetical protein
MHRAGQVGLFPHDLELCSESRDLDLKLRRCGADVNRNLLTLRNAALPGIAFDEKWDGIGGLEHGDEEQEGE